MPFLKVSAAGKLLKASGMNLRVFEKRFLVKPLVPLFK
jgi:hypothetical protein